MRFACLLSVFCVLVPSAGCKKEVDDEGLIRLAITRTARAAEQKDLGGVMEFVNEKVQCRGMDHRELKRFIFGQMRMGAWRKVFLVRTSVELKGERQASAETTALLLRGEEGSIETLKEALPRSTAAYKINLDLEKNDDDQWQVMVADYQRVSDLKALVGSE